MPIVARTEAGFYMDIEPVRAVPATDSEALQSAIMEAMSRGNPTVPTPMRATFPKPVVLKYAKVQSWSAFEKNALNWTIVEESGSYQIKPKRRRPDKGWEDDPEKIESLPPGASVDTVARRVAALAQLAFGQYPSVKS